eukprot:1195116-Prorocentrum_minimum.AAC.8
MRAGDQKIPHYQQPLPSQLSGSSSRAASSGRKRVGGSKCWCSCRASIWLMMLAVTVLNTVPLSFLEDVGDDLPSEQAVFEGSAVKLPDLDRDISITNKADPSSPSLATDPLPTIPTPEADNTLTPLAVEGLHSPDETPQPKIVRHANKMTRVSKPPKKKPPKPSNQQVPTPDLDNATGPGSPRSLIEAETLANPAIEVGDADVDGRLDTESGGILPESSSSMELEAAFAMSAAFEAADAELDGIQTLTDRIINISDPEKPVEDEPTEVFIEKIAARNTVPEDISINVSVNQTMHDAQGKDQTTADQGEAAEEEHVDFSSLLVTPADAEELFVTPDAAKTTPAPPVHISVDAPSTPSPTPDTIASDTVAPTKSPAEALTDPVTVEVPEPPASSSEELLETQLFLSEQPAEPAPQRKKVKKVPLSKRLSLLMQKLQSVPLLLTRCVDLNAIPAGCFPTCTNLSTTHCKH